MAKKKQKKVRVNPHVPAKLATTAATSVDRKAEAVRRPKISHSVQRQPTVGKLARKRKASQSVAIGAMHGGGTRTKVCNTFIYIYIYIHLHVCIYVCPK